MSMLKNNLIFLCLTIFIVSLLVRFTNQHTPFWVDEFSTAEEARLILTYGTNVFTQTTNYFESNNVLTHFITAASFGLLGVGEWQARVPMMIIGALVSVLIFLYTKKYFDQKTALISSLLYTFSYWQITWARQARGYVLQQLLTLAVLYFYQSLLEKFSKIKLFLLILFSVLGLLTHTTFILIIGALLLHFILFYKQQIKKLAVQPIYFILILSALGLTLYFTGQFNSILVNLQALVNDHPNNLSYYHSFLWREQTIITLLAFIGIVILCFKQKKYNQAALLAIPIGFYLFFVSFLFAPYISRYLLPVFPLLILLASVSIAKIGEFISKKHELLWAVVLTLFIIGNGDKFVLKPKPFFSVNHDMREIALIDYDEVYTIITSKGNLQNGQTAVIDPWPDRLKWYLGPDKEYLYSFRWIQSEGTVNGLAKETAFEVNKFGEKYIPRTGNPNIKLIGELSDLETAMDKYPKGFIWIDDATLPAEVIDYVKLYFKHELYVDHYQLDDNPYSIWPGTLYSWGFEE